MAGRRTVVRNNGGRCIARHCSLTALRASSMYSALLSYDVDTSNPISNIPSTDHRHQYPQHQHHGSNEGTPLFLFTNIIH